MGSYEPNWSFRGSGMPASTFLETVNLIEHRLHWQAMKLQKHVIDVVGFLRIWYLDHVYSYHGRKSLWAPTLTGPFPKGQANAVSWLGIKDALYYCAQSAKSDPWVLFVSWTAHIYPQFMGGTPPPPSPIQASVTISATRKYKISHLQLHIPDNYRLGKAVNDKSQRHFPVVAVCDFYQIRSNPPSCIPWHIPLVVLVPYPWSKPITCSFSYFFQVTFHWSEYESPCYR